MRRVLGAIAVSLGVLAAVGCSGSGASGASDVATAAAPAPSALGVPVPGAAWETAPPAELGLDAGKLAEIASLAEQSASNCLLVVRHGKIAGEWYFRGTGPASAQDVFSVSKSVTSTLVGIAQDDGDLAISDNASKWIPEWAGTPSEAVTVRDLLSNDSGRQWSVPLDYGDLLRANDRTAFAIGLTQEHPPGDVWAYNNSAIQTLEQVLERATGRDVAGFAEARLFTPLGMTDTRMTTDGAGNTLTFSGLQSTCRDMARFGYLMLHAGRWGEAQVVSSQWVAEATGTSSTELNAAYGYLWWLNREGLIGSALVATDLSALRNSTAARGQLVPDAPDEMFWALGLGDQTIQVDAASDTVVVRLGALGASPPQRTFGRAEASRVVTDAVIGD